MMLLCFIILLGIGRGQLLRNYQDQIETNYTTFQNTFKNYTNMALAIPFSRAKSDTLYRFGLSIRGLYQTYQQTGANKGRYSLIVEEMVGSRLQTGIGITAYTLMTTNNVEYLQVGWVVIASSFAYLDLVHYTMDKSVSPLTYTNVNSGTNIFPVNTTGFSSVDQSVDIVIKIINGLDIQQSGSNGYYISIKVQHSTTGGVLSTWIETRSNITCKAYYLGVDFVIYHRGAMMAASGLELWFETAILTYSFYYYCMSTSTFPVFFGYGELHKYSSSQTPFYMMPSYLAAGNRVAIDLGSYQQQLFFFFLQFQNYTNCSSPKYFINSTGICGICPNGTYYNSANYTCLSCQNLLPNCAICDNTTGCLNCTLPWAKVIIAGANVCISCLDTVSDCSWCNTNGACSNCTTPYLLTANKTCQLCQTMFPNCHQCNNLTLQCQICIPPYQLHSNNTTCFLCPNITPNCNNCSSTAVCLNCTLPYLIQLNGTCALCTQTIANCSGCNDDGSCAACYGLFQLKYDYTCFLCGNVTSNCSICDNTTMCIECAPPYQLNIADSTCFLCTDIRPNCSICNQTSQCIQCLPQLYLTSTSQCINCTQLHPNCSTCSTVSCLTCYHPYIWNGAICQLNCAMYDLMCGNCTEIDRNVSCFLCLLPTFEVRGNVCRPICGDGVVVAAFTGYYIEQCDDNNTDNDDGCSSTCQEQPYFKCQTTTPNPSICYLTQLNIKPLCLAKQQYTNQVTLSLQLSPSLPKFYKNINWIQSFVNSSHQLSFTTVVYDSQTNRLRVGFSYQESLVGQDVIIDMVPMMASDRMANISDIKLVLPSKSQNNRALYLYSEQTYSFTKIVDYLAIAVSVLSLLLFAAGYFGAKIVALEAVALVQLVAVLQCSLQDTGPTYSGLKQLRLALGVFPIGISDYYYEDSTVPIPLRTVLPSRNALTFINIFLFVFFAPLIAAIILKILSKMDQYTSSRTVQRGWKYALGTFTFYGLLFLAYGHFAYLALALKSFQMSTQAGVGLAESSIFLVVMILWVIGFVRWSIWFGCFLQSFTKFDISQYLYIIQICERLLTSALVISLSPGKTGILAVNVLFFLEFLFIAIKKPYVLGKWKRPLLNKAIAVIICSLYLGATLTDVQGALYQIIPLVILLILFVVIVYSAVIAVPEIKEYWSTQEWRKEELVKIGPPMSFEESQKMLMRDFQRKMIPQMFQNLPTQDSEQQSRQGWHPILHESVDITGWKWDHYPVLNAYDYKMSLKRQKKKVLETKAVQQELDDSQIVQMRQRAGEI